VAGLDGSVPVQSSHHENNDLMSASSTNTAPAPVCRVNQCGCCVLRLDIFQLSVHSCLYTCVHNRAETFSDELAINF